MGAKETYSVVGSLEWILKERPGKSTPLPERKIRTRSSTLSDVNLWRMLRVIFSCVIGIGTLSILSPSHTITMWGLGVSKTTASSGNRSRRQPEGQPRVAFFPIRRQCAWWRWPHPAFWGTASNIPFHVKVNICTWTSGQCSIADGSMRSSVTRCIHFEQGKPIKNRWIMNNRHRKIFTEKFVADYAVWWHVRVVDSYSESRDDYKGVF